MTRCDNEIKDISLYDDVNPDHLHYSCPVCRRLASAASQAAGAVLPPAPAAAAAAAVAVSGATTPSTSAFPPATPAIAGSAAPSGPASAVPSGDEADTPIQRKRRKEDIAAGVAAAVATAPMTRSKDFEDEDEAALIDQSLASLSDRLDIFVTDACRQSALEGQTRDPPVLATQQQQDDLRAFKASLLKRCENVVRRQQREFDRQLDRSRRDLRMQRGEIEEDYARQFRDHIDRLFARPDHLP